MSFLEIPFTSGEVRLEDHDDAAWSASPPVLIERYWSGETAPRPRHAQVRLLWSRTGLYARFEGEQDEPLVISDQPDVTRPTEGLWDRDVFEIFVAPDANSPEHYFEFEIAPTGEWIDIEIRCQDGIRSKVPGFRSGMSSFASVDRDRVLAAIKIPWPAFGQMPKRDDVWAGNLYRCIGSGPERGYLAWQPTETAKPNFHVPQRFGELRFG